MRLTREKMRTFLAYLAENERSTATLEKYGRDLERFYQCLGEDKELTKGRIQHWKEGLVRAGYQAASVNAKLAAVNGLLSYLGLSGLRVKALKRQRAAFCEAGKELSREEYARLVYASRRRGDRRLELILETICSTGIRVSELRFITVEAVCSGRAEVLLKGKCRRILLPRSLVKKLKAYLKERRLTAGVVFRTRTGNPVSRHQVWAWMKGLCEGAGVEPGKVFPHNLRHLFARMFYALERDIAKLADLLGHSSIETTRIYILTTGHEHLQLLDRMRLII